MGWCSGIAIGTMIYIVVEGDLLQSFFIICFVECTTRASPVGIPRDIYRICFYINVCMYVYLFNCLFSIYDVS